jgi:hypothetical protein
MQKIKAIALVGFYHGEPLIQPGQVIDLSPKDFNELRGMQKVDAWVEPAKEAQAIAESVKAGNEPKAAKKGKAAE